MKTKTSLEKSIMSDKLDQWRDEKRRQYIAQKKGNVEVIIALTLSAISLIFSSLLFFK